MILLYENKASSSDVKNELQCVFAVVDLIDWSSTMSERMDDSNSEFKLKLAIKTPKEKKDIAVNASATVKQVISFLYK